MVETDLSKAEQFENFLLRKKQMDETRKLYLMYFKKLLILLQGTRDMVMDQDVVNAFIDVYPNNVARAFLKNYLEYKDLHLTIQKITGRAKQKVVIKIPEHEIELIREGLYRKDERYGLIFDLTEGCALRRQEVLNIKGSDIEVKEGEDDSKMFIIIKKAKGNKERWVFVPTSVSIKLYEYLLRKKILTSEFVFKSRVYPERHVEKSWWDRVFSKVAYQVTGKKYHPHQLRHSRSLKWYDNGVDILRIKNRLGHSNISTTMLYINPDNRKELERWSKEN